MSKRYQEAVKKIEKEKLYELKDGVALVKEIANAKFDESLDVAMNLGVDPRHSDQMVRGSVLLRNGLGKKIRVLVFAKGEKEEEALKAGADYVGGEDMVTKIKSGWMDFERVVATPDMMSVVSKLGRILGPRGLMPNPKLGTVTTALAKMIPQIKQGQVEYKVDKAGILHASVGRASFSTDKLLENLVDFLDSVRKAKPATSKGKYVKAISISTTMGPGINIDPGVIERL